MPAAVYKIALQTNWERQKLTGHNSKIKMERTDLLSQKKKC